jgi:hypothetical protein
VCLRDTYTERLTGGGGAHPMLLLSNHELEMPA